MVSARSQWTRIPQLSHFHHGGICSAPGSGVRVADLLSDHWLFGKAPPCSPNLTPQGHRCGISIHSQVFLVPLLMVLIVLLQWYSHPLTSFHFWYFLIPSFLWLSFTLPLLTLMSLWVPLGLCKDPPALSHPPFPPMISKAARVYFHWSSLHAGQCFISSEWTKLHSCCLCEQKQLLVCEHMSPVCFAHSSLGWEKNKKTHETEFRGKKWKTEKEVGRRRMMWSKPLWFHFFEVSLWNGHRFLTISHATFYKWWNRNNLR